MRVCNKCEDSNSKKSSLNSERFQSVARDLRTMRVINNNKLFLFLKTSIHLSLSLSLTHTHTHTLATKVYVFLIFVRRNLSAHAPDFFVKVKHLPDFPGEDGADERREQQSGHDVQQRRLRGLEDVHHRNCGH